MLWINKEKIMDSYPITTIPISQLKLDTENSRHSSVSSQLDAINWMLDSQGGKIYALANHLYKFGPDPSQNLIVIEDKNNKKSYIVLEGNRRLTAIKLLDNPDLVSNQALNKKVKKLLKEQIGVIPQELSCVIFKSQNDAYEFIELKHTGEQGGAGTVNWDSLAIQRG